jgi:uncharacterized RDD family membrane protein YckC
MNCPACGQLNHSTTRFCTACGSALAGPAPAFRGPVQHYAGFGRRVGAFVIDMLLVYVVLFVGGAVWITQGMKGNPQLNAWILLLYPAVWAVGWLYWAGLESSGLQGTVGKRAAGLMVTDIAGQRISFGRATGRYFGKILSAMLFYVGFLMAAFTDKKQALHDMLSGTLVVLRPEGPLAAVNPGPGPGVWEQNDMNKPFYR